VREEDGVGQVGDIRLWLDIYDTNHRGKQQAIRRDVFGLQTHRAAQEWQIRILVKQVTGISVFKDWAQRNDAKVRGVFRTRNYAHQEYLDVVETDVHPWARDQANFNWMWIFNVKSPLAMCSIMLELIDVDMIGEELIYKQEEFALDHDMLSACQSGEVKKRNVRVYWNTPGVESLTDCSDIFPCIKWLFCTMPWCARRCHRSGRGQDTVDEPAVLHLELEILPKIMAEANPKGAGRAGPPQGRMGWSMLVEDPLGFLKIALGPWLYKNSARCCCFSLCACLVLVALWMVYMFKQVFLVT